MSSRRQTVGKRLKRARQPFDNFYFSSTYSSPHFHHSHHHQNELLPDAESKRERECGSQKMGLNMVVEINLEFLHYLLVLCFTSFGRNVFIYINGANPCATSALFRPFYSCHRSTIRLILSHMKFNKRTTHHNDDIIFTYFSFFKNDVHDTVFFLPSLVLLISLSVFKNSGNTDNRRQI